MSLISGKEAFNAVLDGKSVLWRHVNQGDWLEWTKNTAWCVEALEHDSYQFRIKPRTIMLDGIEVPATFKPKEGDEYWSFDLDLERGYASHSHIDDGSWIQFGAWRTESDIKQVVAALREVFK